ncbi:MAG: hypothetical protein NTW19_01910 [Planctomycetota bacterium]|nr:hypothetical protein [Planctomycetota bacterium]
MPSAIFTTWTTYGTWLPGDGRGWFTHGRLRSPDHLLRFESALRMRDDAIWLDPERRALIEKTIADHCVIRNWALLAVNCRTNHVHVVVVAPGRPIDVPREQFKAWCTRRLDEQEEAAGSSPREEWWTQRGWDVYLDYEEAVEMAVSYVRDCQNHPLREFKERDLGR